MKINWMRVLSYIATFKLGSTLMANVAVFLVRHDKFPILEQGWAALLNIFIWLALMVWSIFYASKGVKNVVVETPSSK